MFGKSRGKHGWSSRPTRYSHMCFFKSKWKHPCRFGETGRKKHNHIIQEEQAKCARIWPLGQFLIWQFSCNLPFADSDCTQLERFPANPRNEYGSIFFMHFQYCGRQESQTDKAKLPWYRHIVPTQPKHQMGWRPTLIRYFIPWTINYFVVQ